MTRPTRAGPPPASRAAAVGRRRTGARELAAPLIGAALYAAIELGGGLAGLFALGRAEALLFLALRPWLLILAAACVAGSSWRRRLCFYGIAIALAALSETVLLFALGAEDPVPEMARGAAAGALVVLIADGAIQLARRWHKAAGTAAALLLLLGLAASGLGLRPYEALALGRTAPGAPDADRPRLLLMTSLPIVWGAGGAFDPNSRPAESYRLLEREFRVTPIDSIDEQTLRGRRLMMLAQPRVLAPEELVVLDGWVRAGGRVLILTDPSFVSARELPLLDIRRPPEAGLLGPLLAHWGLSLERGPDGRVETQLRNGQRRRKLAMLAPGRFAVSGNACRIDGQPWLAHCLIGSGEAILVGDADLLMDLTWTAPDNPRGSERHLRIADNPLLVVGWLDHLAVERRPRTDGAVDWIHPAADSRRALLFAALPILFALALGLALLYWGRRTPTNLSTGLPTENNNRTEVTEEP